MPPTQVALADNRTPLYHNVAIYEVLNVPEVRWFDGDAVFTTRPTRTDVIESVSAWLDNADMLAPNIGEADYLLTLRFEDVHGPDVIWFTDKHANATVHYTLTCQRAQQFRSPMRYGDLRSRCTAPGQTIFEGTYEAHLQMRMPGVTPEMVRAGITSGILSAMLAPEIRDSGAVVANSIGLGAILGDASARGVGSDAFRFDLNQVLNLLALEWNPIEDLPRFDDLESLGVFGSGLIVGADSGQNSSSYSTDRLRAAVNGAGLAWLATNGDNDDTTTSDAAARWQGAIAGAAVGVLGAAPAGRPVDHWNSHSAIGAFDGTQRRYQAVRGMLRQDFDQFLFGLQGADLLHIREAVPCADLNPNGYGAGILTSTSDSVGYDCPIGRTRPVNPGLDGPLQRNF